MAKVLAVDDVQLTLAKSHPPQIIVDALGKVSTSGWTHPELSPYTYFVPPQDGILDFDFNAQPPVGLVLTVIRPLSATTSFAPPSWLKGVRIHAATGEPKVKMLYDEAQLAITDKAKLDALQEPGGWISSGKSPLGGADGFPWLIAPRQA